MELLYAIVIMVSGIASFPGLVAGDTQYVNLEKTRMCDKDHYIKTQIFTMGNKPFEPRMYVPCNEWKESFYTKDK